MGILRDIIWQKCPRCHEGNLFDNPNPYNPKQILDMPKQCPKCKQAFFLEPGFYFGAMYVSYGLSVLIGLIAFVIASVLFKLSLNNASIVTTLVLLLVLPYEIRLSRAIWLALFYKEKKIFNDGEGE
jgi:ribosomal protein S27AE